MRTACLLLAFVVAAPAWAGPRFQGCTDEQRGIARQALADARRDVGAARSALAEGRWRRRARRGEWNAWEVWFGEWSDERARTVETVLDRSARRLTGTAPLEVLCGAASTACREDTVAWASPGFPFLGLCTGFFHDPQVDRAAVVVHEVTHLAAGTRDTTHGEIYTRTLARRDADLAVRNAESYEAFVATLAGRRAAPEPVDTAD